MIIFGNSGLDNKTLQHIIDSLGYHEDSSRGPRSQSLTFGYQDYEIYTKRDLREWLAGLMHHRYLEFLPESSTRTKGELPTHLKVTCSCGEFERTVPVAVGEYEGAEAELERISGEHYRKAVEAVLDRYKYDDDED